MHKIMPDPRSGYQSDKKNPMKAEALPQTQIMNRFSLSFQQEIVYGVQLRRVDISSGNCMDCTVYLHEKYPNLLMILNHSPRYYRIYDFKHCCTESRCFRWELEFGIKQYFILRQGAQSEIIVFQDAPTRNYIYGMFKKLIAQYRFFFPEISSLALKLFLEADSSNNGAISESELSAFFDRLKITPDDHVNKILSIVKKNYLGKNDMLSSSHQKGELQIQQFETFTKLLDCKLQLKQIFENCLFEGEKGHSGLNTYMDFLEPMMSRRELEYFLKTHQNMSDRKQCNELALKILGTKEKLSFYEFCVYIFSKENNAIDKTISKQKLSQDYQLNNYYVFSSHNTYLSGNQLTSDSKIQRYIEDLENGIRCVELDVHDDGDTPIIKHGYTATKPVTFEDVIKAIAHYCDADPSHTPIILSIENHCCLRNQDKIAHILTTYFFDSNQKLLLFDQKTEYPTLEQARGKIIVKCSGRLEDLRPGYSDSQLDIKPGIFELKNSQSTLLFLKSPPKKYLLPPNFVKQKNLFIKHIVGLQSKQAEFDRRKEYFQNMMAGYGLAFKQKDLSAQLLSITAMLSQGKLGKPSIWQSVSIGQNKFMAYKKQNPKGIIKHCQQSWVRTYPTGSRFDSSNYNPIPMLELGAQIVALNTQHRDIETCLLFAFFKSRKKSRGYRLKPNYLRSETDLVVQNAGLHIRLKVLSLHRLSIVSQEELSEITVNIGFFGTQKDCKLNPNAGLMLPFTEKIVGNSFNPLFKNSRQFSCVCLDIQFGFIVIEVPGCVICALPVQSLRSGYRTVLLCDYQMKEKDCYALVHVMIRQRQ